MNLSEIQTGKKNLSVQAELVIPFINCDCEV